MRLGAFTLIGLTALIAATEPVSARDGCGRGMAYNGYTCVPDPYYQAPPPPGYGGGYYNPGYGGGDGYRRPDPGDYGPQTNRNQDCYNVGGQRICCPKNWTVQDGRCQPYRGR